MHYTEFVSHQFSNKLLKTYAVYELSEQRRPSMAAITSYVYYGFLVC